MATKDDQKSATAADANQEAPKNTEEAREQSLATLKEQESNKPVPSQEEADEIKLRQAKGEGSAAYETRAASKK